MTRSTGSPSSKRIEVEPAAHSAPKRRVVSVDRSRSDSPWGLSDRSGCVVSTVVIPEAPDPPFTSDPAYLSPSTRSPLLLAVLLVCVTIGLAVWGGGPATRSALSAGNDLLADHSSFKLKPEQGDGAVHAAREVPEPAPAQELPSPSSTPEFVAGLPNVVLAPTLPPPTLANEEPYAAWNLHRGDTPMMRTWTLLGWHALLAATLTATPTFAAEPADVKAPEKPAVSTDDFKKLLQQELGGVNQAIADLKKDIKSRHDSINSVIIDLDVKYEKNVTELDELKKQLAQLKKDLDGLRGTVNTMNASAATTRVSGFTPTEQGRIQLINSYLEPVTITLNQFSYRLQPGERRLLENQRAGAFTYQVQGVQLDPQNRTLAAGETVTINVYTR